MKKIIVLMMLLWFVTSVNAQKLKESDVPAVVKQAFAKQFTTAKNVKWSMENENEFEAEFKSSSGERSANFDKTGKWLVTETKISEKDMPAAVLGAIKKEFAGYKLESPEKVESAYHGIFFELELEKGEKSYEVQISADGKILKKEEEKESSNKKD